MRRPLKIALFSLGTILFLVVIGILIARNVLTSKIENYLSNSLPESMKVEYSNLDLSILSGSLKLNKPTVTMFVKTTDSMLMRNEMSSIIVEDIGYWNYLIKDKITIENIQIINPKITYYQHEIIDSVEDDSSKSKSNNNPILIKNFNINNGEISMIESTNDSLLVEVHDLNIKLKDIYLDNETSTQKIPFKYSDYHLSFDNLFYRMNEFENLKIGKSVIAPDSSNFGNFKLYTKHSKLELSRMISKERDHVDLNVDNVTIYNETFGYHQDSIFYFKSPKLVFSNPVFALYRDKLIDDDLTIKSLYSRLLRSLTFDLTLSEVILKNASINYSEKVNTESSAGEISFKQLNASIKNLGNTFSSSENTNIDIDAIFMKTTPIKINWYFDVNNVSDHFVFKAEIGRLPAQDLNPFSEPNLKVMFEGELQKTYFTIDGNYQESSVDLRTNYQNFKVTVLDKEHKKKNKVLSAIANLIIKKDSKKEDDNFREGSKTNIERDNTKSVFNFIWMNAKDGLLSALTGNGKK